MAATTKPWMIFCFEADGTDAGRLALPWPTDLVGLPPLGVRIIRHGLHGCFPKCDDTVIGSVVKRLLPPPEDEDDEYDWKEALKSTAEKRGGVWTKNTDDAFSCEVYSGYAAAIWFISF